MRDIGPTLHLVSQNLFYGKKMFLCFLNMTACLVEQFEQFVVNNMRVKLLEFTLSSMVQGLKANKEYLNTEW